MTARVSDAMNSAGGWILDHHQFSNKALCINFEIDVDRLARLHAALLSTGLNLSPESSSSLTSTPADAGESATGTLSLLFVHDEPDLRLPEPPG